MEYIDDLSQSNIVDKIQGEDIKGADFIYVCSLELEDVRAQIKEIENKLNMLKSRERSLVIVGRDVAKHLKKELPLYVKRKDIVIKVTDNDLIINTNVI